jgi:integrase
MYALVLMALNCGARKGELMELRRKDVDWSNNTVSVLRTKNDGYFFGITYYQGSTTGSQSKLARLDI